MKKCILFLMLILLMPSKISAISDPDFIDVKIGKTYQTFEKLNISSDSNLALFKKDDLENESFEFDDNKLYVGKTFGANNKIDVYDSENHYITSIPSNGSVLIGSNLLHESIIEVGEKRYRGYISFISSASGLNIINHIDIENYIKGVVPREMPSLSPIEALKAQAVAARSYAYSTLGKHSKDGYNLCDTTHCQVYGGFSDENKNTNKAIEDTKGMVVKFNGSIANTVFHSSSGGFTESSENIWGNKLYYLKGKEDPYSLNSKNSSWTVELDKNLLLSSLNKNGYAIREVKDIKILSTYASGRVRELCINENNEKFILTGDKFRSLMGTNNIKSTLFKIEGLKLDNEINNNIYIKDKNNVSLTRDIHILSSKNLLPRNNSSYNIIAKNNKIKSVEASATNSVNGNIIISGKGYGHGVGMSQYGAMEMARQGYDYIDILEHYYSDIDLTKIN